MIGSSNAVIRTGGGAPSELSTTGIDFIDYDGTVLAHYDSVPTTLPTAPTVEGLTFQEWNWTLEELQEYFTAVPDGYVCVGATRVPSDGKTHIFVSLSAGRLSPLLHLFRENTNTTVTVDWGDNTVETWSGATAIDMPHTYAQAGDYEIKISAEGGHIYADNGSPQGTQILLDPNYQSSDSYSHAYNAYITEIWFGSNFWINRSSLQYSLYYSFILEKVVIPNTAVYTDSVISLACTFYTELNKLRCVVLPHNTPPTLGSSVFGNCSNLSAVAIPDGVTSIGNNTFSGCQSLTSINIPDGVTSIGAYAFSGCQSLTSINIPDGVTSIGAYAFYGCQSLTSINIPDGVTSIGNNTFSGCYRLAEVHLQPTTPPTLSNVNAFTNTPNDMVIYVPQGTLEAYQQATNWTTYASQMQEEP